MFEADLVKFGLNQVKQAQPNENQHSNPLVPFVAVLLKPAKIIFIVLCPCVVQLSRSFWCFQLEWSMQGGVGYQVRYRIRRIEHNQLLEKSFISWLISSSFLEFLSWLEVISFLATVRITPYHIYTNVRHWRISLEYFPIDWGSRFSLTWEKNC